MLVILDVLTAYILADLLSGVYHILADNGWTIKQHVEGFAYHHKYPDKLVIDLKATIGGIPIMCVSLLNWHPIFWVILGLCICLAQVPHYWAHFPERVGPVVRALQKAHLILTPYNHSRHHLAFNRNYCVISGWNNFWMNWILVTKE